MTEYPAVELRPGFATIRSHHKRTVRKFLRGILLLAVFLSAFGTSGLSSADAREAAVTATATATATATGNVLSDGQFVYGPNVGDFNVATYLAAHAPDLLASADDLYGRAEYFSINPKIYLTLMEIRSHAISNPDPAATADPFNLKSGDLNSQIEYLSNNMTAAYYLHLYSYSSLPLSQRSLAPFVGPGGARVSVAPDTNAGTYAIIAGLTALDEPDIASLLDNSQPGGFYQTYLRLFGNDDPRDENNQVSDPEEAYALAAPDNFLQLPYLQGLAWKFGGVHDNSGGGGVGSPLTDASSLDFYPGGLAWGADTSVMWVVASAAGTPTKYSACGFKVSHGGGWETTYYHLENIQNYSGSIRQNDKIGVIANTLAEATCTGGSASGPHVHFSLKYNGAYVAINGTPLSGWYVHSGRTSYDVDPNYMWLERAGTKKFPFSDVVLSEGGSALVLTVASTNPASGVVIATTPTDTTGQGNGTTPFARSYTNGISVTLTAPLTAVGNQFSSWIGCTSTSGAICTVTMDAARTVRAYYRNQSIAASASNDFDGDGRSDIGCYYPNGGNWYGMNSGNGFWQTQFGYAGTLPISGDFDGDGKSDIGCYHPPSGSWYVMKSTEGFATFQFGYSGTIPIVGDFDGDGKDDIGCYHANTGSWYMMKSTEGFATTQFGYAGTIPIVGDFDGDGKDDIGCYFPPGGNWYMMKSTEGFATTQFGYAGTIPIVGDFDSDGRDDIGCYSPPGGNWYVMRSAKGFATFQFGYIGTEPVVGDFDGDGKSDLGCYYPLGGNWYVLKSTEGFWQGQFGYGGTIPLGGTLR